MNPLEEEVIVKIRLQIYDAQGNHYRDLNVEVADDNDFFYISQKVHEHIYGRANQIEPYYIKDGDFLFQRRKLRYYATVKQEMIPNNAVVKLKSPYIKTENGCNAYN